MTSQSTWTNEGLWTNAKADLITAKHKGANIVALFRKAPGSVAAFEAEQGVNVPADIAALLSS